MIAADSVWSAIETFAVINDRASPVAPKSKESDSGVPAGVGSDVSTNDVGVPSEVMEYSMLWTFWSKVSAVKS